jgi:hypothetical protein
MNQFNDNPRDYALELVKNGVSADYLLLACLKYMSHDDVRDMLDCNELSPRFDDELKINNDPPGHSIYHRGGILCVCRCAVPFSCIGDLWGHTLIN